MQILGKITFFTATLSLVLAPICSTPVFAKTAASSKPTVTKIKPKPVAKKPVVTKKVPVKKVPAKKVPIKKVPAKPKAPASVSMANGSQYQQETVQTANGPFVIDLVTIPLTSTTKVLSETASPTTCYHNCPVKSLQDYTNAEQGFAAIHGAYFCPADYPSCTGQFNAFDAPFFNSDAHAFVRPEKLSDPVGGSLMVFDAQNRAYFYPNRSSFEGLAGFEATHRSPVAAAIANTPPLVYNGQNIVAGQAMDQKQLTTKSSRGGIGVKGQTVYLVIAHSATVPDLAAIFSALGVDNALNLDGGGSSALYFDGAYRYGPGRQLPSAIVFKDTSNK